MSDNINYKNYCTLLEEIVRQGDTIRHKSQMLEANTDNQKRILAQVEFSNEMASFWNKNRENWKKLLKSKGEVSYLDMHGVEHRWSHKVGFSEAIRRFTKWNEEAVAFSRNLEELKTEALILKSQIRDMTAQLEAKRENAKLKYGFIPVCFPPSPMVIPNKFIPEDD